MMNNKYNYISNVNSTPKNKYRNTQPKDQTSA